MSLHVSVSFRETLLTFKNIVFWNVKSRKFLDKYQLFKDLGASILGVELVNLI